MSPAIAEAYINTNATAASDGRRNSKGLKSMKANTGTALLAALLLAGMSTAVVADTKADESAAEKVETVDAKDARLRAMIRDAERARAESLQAEAARDAAEAVLTATKLDLDIRLIGPTSIAGEL